MLFGNASIPRPFAMAGPANSSFNVSEPRFDSIRDSNAVANTVDVRYNDASHRDAENLEENRILNFDGNYDDMHDEEFANTFAVMHAVRKLGSVLNATSTIKQTYANWVGSAFNASRSSRACWRKAHFAKRCPLGFERRFGICWTQCPYSYPIECGLECIKQNDDCGSAIFYKIAVVVQTAISLSGWSIYGDMTKWSRSVQVAVKCVKYMISITKSLVRYIRFIKVYHPETTQDKILSVLYQADNIIIDIPVTIAYCIGKRASDEVKFADSVVTTAEYIIMDVVSNGDFILSSWDEFTNFMKRIALGDSMKELKGSDIKSLKTALKSNTTCGFDLKRLLDRTWMTVAELRLLNPEISEDDIRVVMSQSNLMLNDIPIATNNCMAELLVGSDEHTAYATRDTLRKTFAAIVDDLISSGTSDNGTMLNFYNYAFKIADRAIGFYAIWDFFYVSSVVSQYVQPICGPTQLIGEIDDGDLTKALAMSIVQGAFNNSSGMWTKVGDGSVKITFKSVDKKDVAVNIKSGGDKIDEVIVRAGETVVWESNVSALGGKTLYLDRWRPGFLDFPSTGGGSLLLWVPQSAHNGSLQLTAMLNAS
ncbi:uncharacterized protein PHALS_01111 [Plasmopara halstedii]|uniref:Uncharacterized protein n=1 Tax=Plasmopara halstedii TaxID=4781 RepID=A0A0P1AUH2_PLAHL|nr:uncharacterized protein PHALS_01111 [Plasmopara halstedii]CEG44773.1 hypothetical protein PHALS_01111 [Plasmopara halstedii]|eukprot:XP_024581142.1 hypothetical protein PHALS_01111 [Plasmopara halstedii]